MKHSLKGYADDVTLISNDVDAYTSVLQTIDEKAADLDLFCKPIKCVSYRFNGSRIIPHGISLSNGVTRSIVEGETKFLGKLISVSLSATKRAAGKQMITRLTTLLNATDSPCIHGEYKLWILETTSYRCYVFTSVFMQGTISQMEPTATRYLKKWLNLPCSVTRVILSMILVFAVLALHMSHEKPSSAY